MNPKATDHKDTDSSHRQMVFRITEALPDSQIDDGYMSDKLYCRKEKSLGELCKKFLALYGKKNSCTVNLNICIQQLGVERRRIYDIINIMEGLGVVMKKCKNIYEWMGFEKLMQQISNFELSAKRKKSAFVSKQINAFTISFIKNPLKCEKSLGFLCLHFINFIILSGNEVSLIQCANDFIRLHQREESIGRITSIIRRLYDVANVLSSLGLLQKIDKASITQKKPYFKWLGTQGLIKIMPEEEESRNNARDGFTECAENKIVIKKLMEEGKSNKLSLLSLGAIIKRKYSYFKGAHCKIERSPSYERTKSTVSTDEKSPMSPLKRKCIIGIHASPLKDLTNFNSIVL